MPRYFTLEEAEELLPAVEEWLRAAVEARGRMAAAESEMMDLRRHVIAMGGVRPDAAKALTMRARRDSAAAEMERGVEEMEGVGVQVKDLEMGLIDFPTLYHGREVLLCYRLGEAGIGYWHEVDGGFRGRRAIDGEFVENHEGGVGE